MSAEPAAARLRWTVADADGSHGCGQQTLFDEPERVIGRGEFRGLEFVHVRARRIINTVDSRSPVPFDHTINAYRGCSHACSYCVSGETPMLMADGRTKPLSDIRPGNRVYGTERRGAYRRYVITEVLDHWSTVRPAYRVTLADGTELVASADHRFLSDRGWKHVTGAEHGPLQRPFLTIDDKLIGTGHFAEPPKHDDEYQRGYLCGMVRSDGHLGHFSCPEPDGRSATEWPREPSDQWCKGFLAGIFDAEGCYRSGVLRISNTDEEIIRRTTSCLRRFGFSYIVEPTRLEQAKPVSVVRLTRGLREQLRFFLTVDPAITRKRTFAGRALKSDAPLRVVSIEPLGIDIPMYDLTTGTGDFIADGVVSHNCFARPTHEYLGLDPGDDFDRVIVVKVNAIERLRAELLPSRWAGAPIAMGTNTDPYQRAEGKYRLTRGIIETLGEARNPFSILTKGTLVLRDLDVLTEAAQRTKVSLSFSIGTLDDDVWQATERGTPHPRKRVEAVAKLNEAGIPCGVLVAPVLPGLSDHPDQLDEVVRSCVDAGARSITPVLLHLRPGVREHYLAALAGHRPDLVARHRAMYARGAYASAAERKRISGLVHAAVKRHSR